MGRPRSGAETFRLPDIGAVALVLPLAIAIGCGPPRGVPPALRDPALAHSVTLVESGSGGELERRVLIEDRAAVDSLLRLARFTPKSPCRCAHVERMEVATDSGSVVVSLCRHCFDVAGGSEPAHFEMAPEFYEAFRARLDE